MASSAAKRLLPISTELRNELLESSAPEWGEKVRRFCGLYGRVLRVKAKERFGESAEEHLLWMAELMLKRSVKSSLICDPAYLSAGLYALDALTFRPIHLKKLAEDQLTKLLKWHQSKTITPPLPIQGPHLKSTFDHWRKEARSSSHRFLIICPNPTSLYTSAVLKLCVMLELPVVGILIRSFTLERFQSEFQRDGLRLVRKIWRKLVLRANENADDSPISLSRLIERLRSESNDVRKVARVHGIPVLNSPDWETERTLEWVANRKATIGLFTGGGITRAGLQRQFSTGILNAHMGHLPAFKGMDVVESPLLEGRRANVGATVHLMDRGLDTGAILQRVDVNPDEFSSIGALRNTIGGLLPLLLLDSALGLSSGRLTPLSQESSGRQYYVIHPKLNAVVSTTMKCHYSSQKNSYSEIFDQLERI